MKVLRKIIEIDKDLCTGCGNCVLDCQEGAIQIVNGKAEVISDNLCDGMGNCIGRCPTGALQIIERESDPYELEAVQQHLAGQGRTHGDEHHGAPKYKAHGQGGCGSHSAPGYEITKFAGSKHANPGHAPHGHGMGSTQGGCGCSSSIPVMPQVGAKNWPVKLRLASSIAFGADVLLTADCAAQVAEEFSKKYANGKTLLTICPKFEDREMLAAKLADLFRQSKPKSVTSIRMEVPCCSGIGPMGREAVRLSGIDTVLREIILTRGGEELH